MFFAISGFPFFLALVPAVPHGGLAGSSLTFAVCDDGVMKLVEPGVAHPLALHQSLGGAAAFALAGAPVGGGGGHLVMACVSARVIC